MAMVAAEDAMDTSTQQCLYHLSLRHSAMIRTMGGQSMAWKKPLAHQTGVMTSIAFPGVIRTIFTYVLPFGFVGYYPAAYLTGKTGSWVLAGLSSLPSCTK